MKFLNSFFKQKVPKAGTEMPAYYRSALTACEWLLALYFALNFFFIAANCLHWEFMPVAMLAVTLISLWNMDRTGPRLSLGLYGALTLIWCAWFVRALGWSCGIQHLIFPLVVLVFFNIFDPPWVKTIIFAALLGARMLLFSWFLSHPPVYELSQSGTVFFQTLNSLTTFAILAVLCIHFSSNLQDAERQLRIDNQELHREAGTDPLTQLPNRRAMMDVIDRFVKDEPEAGYCVAIADIDFFKRVNDTYGHLCGDYTLRTLADRFREAAGTRYRVCRWGGEEFCFFLPGMNLDDAGKEMMDLNVAVSRMQLSFEGTDFAITITVGVEEYDFRSPIKDIIARADRKLYMGKEGGRNQVVV